MYIIDKIPVIFYGAFIIWILHNSAEVRSIKGSGFIIALYNFNTDWRCPGNEHIYCLWKYFIVHEKFWSCNMIMIVIHEIKKHSHRFSSCSCFIQQRSISYRQTGKIAYHRLKIQKAFKTSLRNFCLVWSVLCIPTWIFENIAQYYRWCNGIIISLADIIVENFIL